MFFLAILLVCRTTLFDTQTKQIFISRDVFFYEEMFPLHSLTPREQLVDHFSQVAVPVPTVEITLPTDVVQADDIPHRSEPTQTHYVLLYIDLPEP